MNHAEFVTFTLQLYWPLQTHFKIKTQNALTREDAFTSVKTQHLSEFGDTQRLLKTLTQCLILLL